MNKEEIFNQYAKEQGFESWHDFACNYKSKGYSTHSFLEHQNKVTDLIQEELLKKASKQLILGQTLNKAQQSILNTEIL